MEPKGILIRRSFGFLVPLTSAIALKTLTPPLPPSDPRIVGVVLFQMITA
jgi:hypothetical protein